MSVTEFASTLPNLRGPVAFDASDARLFTSPGVLLRVGPRSGDVRRTPLEPPPPAPRVGTRAAAVRSPAVDNIRIFADSEGRVAFARQPGRIGVVLPDGGIELVQGATCSAPDNLAPAGPRRVIAVCRDGVTMMIGAGR